MSTPTLLPPAALTRPPPSVATPGPPFVGPALVRAALYLIPVVLALAAAEPLSQVPWQVPVAAAVLVWCAGRPLTYLGHQAAARFGPPAAVRLVLAGFAGVALAWSSLLAALPTPLVGDRLRALTVSLPAVALLAAVAAALVTGSEAALLRWSLPALAVAAAWLADAPAVSGATAGWALLAGIGLMLARASAPAWRGAGLARPGLADLGPACGHLWLGLGQAAAVVGLWRVGDDLAPASAGPAAVSPLLVAVPLTELWIAWHVATAAAGRRGPLTLAAPLAILGAGTALVAAAEHLPYGLSAHPVARGVVLVMAAGVLLAGLVAVGLLLSARHRPGLAAAVMLAPVAATPLLALGVPGLAAESLRGLGALAPVAVAVLTMTLAVALVLTAAVMVDPRSRS